MPITVSAHDRLGLRCIVFDGALLEIELRQLAIWHGLSPHEAAPDTIAIIAEQADLTSIAPPLLDEFRHFYRALYIHLDLLVMRRCAWLCADARWTARLEHWLRPLRPHDREGGEVRLFASLQDAGGLFDSDELEAVRLGEGFEPRIRIAGEAFI